ncbi:recombination regulator RecX [Apilactobacillus timberlakei]|uniref:recombination regulator RecX n=1 Tax=Apilactobacillus timberlakei TaxID=2008380 RepID=UPI0011264EF3|nr:recombination regulator RecX [Apilactobacillus timberlakei]TPR14575.1 recombination regulator RecX [Apilactobacillus timberlakei]
MNPKITKISSQKRKGRFNVYIDDHYAFPISENVMIKYRVFKGMEVDEKLKHELINADNISKLYSKAIDFLSHQLRTENEVVKKLSNFTEDDSEIETVINQLKGQHLINDQNYADSYVRTEVKKQDKGPANVFFKLKSKSVSEDKIQNAIENFYSDEDTMDNCVVQAKKIFNKHKRDAFKNRIQKTKVNLIKKGYSTDTVISAIDSLSLEPDDEQQENLLAEQGEKFWLRNKKYDNQKRSLKTKQSLYRKGFNIDDINHFIDSKLNNF